MGLILAIILGLSLVTRTQQSESDQAGGCGETIAVGKSVNGTEIKVCKLNGSVDDSGNALLVVGSVHGDEPAGKQVAQELIAKGVRDNSEIWVLVDANPDGAILSTRRNANEVDINRNFPINWLASEIGTKTYSGPSPASEPETQALMVAVNLIKPTRVITFHQPYAQIDCSPDRPNTLSHRLSELTGFISECIPGEKSGSPTNTYTGTFTIWVNGTFPQATALTFELGLSVGQAKVRTIVKALQAVATDEAYLP